MKNRNNNGKLTLMKKHKASFQGRTRGVLMAICFIFALVVGSSVFGSGSNVFGKSLVAATMAVAPIAVIGTPEEEASKKALLETISDRVKALLEKEDELTKKEIKQLKADVQSLNDAAKEGPELKSEVIRIAGELKALQEGVSKKEDGLPTIRKALEENIAKLKALKAGNDKATASENQFSIKAAGTMLESGNVSGGNVPVEQRISGLNTIASRVIRLLDIFTKANASSNIISWVYQANKDGAAGGTAEGATKNQIDFDLVVASQVVVKRTAYIKISDEMIDDVDFIESEINNELMRELLKDIELTAYSGNGTAPALNGVRTVATAFAAGDFALAVDNANEVDVLTVAMNQVRIADQEPANYILMHPTDVAKQKLIKVSATDKRYVDRLLTVGTTMYLDGVPIIETTLVTAGTYLVGAFNLATLYSRKAISIEVGLDGNDFTKNLRTIRAEWRGALVVKNNDRTAFVKGTFSTDKAALETA